MALSPVVDVHTHLAPELAEQSDHEGPAALYSADALISWMATAGIDRAWVSPPPPFFRQGMSATHTAEWVRELNDGLATRVADHGQLHGLVYLPLDQPEVALNEMLHRLEGAGAYGWIGSAGGGSLPLDDPRFVSLWAALERAGRPMMLHPGASPDRRLDAHYLSNLLGNPVETGVAAAQLVMGDVLGRYPGLKILLAHCGGAVTSVAGRWQRGVDTLRPGIKPPTIGPHDALRRLWVDALAHHPSLVDLALEVFGPDKVVLGSDWPFPMGYENPVAELGHLDHAAIEAIARHNIGALGGQR